MSIKVTLLGTPKVTSDDREISFPYRKAEGLFYYLCVKESVSRDEIIGIFWADSSEDVARKNLRDALYHLKRLFGENTITSIGNNRLVLSIDQFETIDFRNINKQNILETYSDEFLGYFYVKNCLEFENWVDEVRLQLSSMFREAVEGRIRTSLENQDGSELAECGKLLLKKKILNVELFESILRGMLECEAYDEGIQLCKRMAELMRKEYDEEPEQELIDISKRLQQGAENKRKSMSPGNGGKFFCREKEMLGIMEELYFFHSGNFARSVLLSGAAGVGKTSILIKLKEYLTHDKYSVIRYRCVENEKELYLKPWSDILNALEKICRENCIQVYYEMPDMSEFEDGESYFDSQYELYAESMLQALTDSGSDRKVVLILDDVQWMDEGSLRLLKELILWARNRKVLVIMTCRTDDRDGMPGIINALSERDLLKIIEVNCFSMEDVSTIVREVYPNRFNDSKKVSEIYKITGGNALFLFEHLKTIKQGNTGRVSSKISDSIEGTLASLSDEEKEILNVISIQPRFATPEDLEYILKRKPDEFQKVLDRLCRLQIIQPENSFDMQGFGFPHLIIKEHMYNSIPKKQRTALHRSIAGCYEEKYRETEDSRWLPHLIHHFNACRDMNKYYFYHLEYLRSFYSVEHEIYPTVLFSGSRQIMPQLDGEDQLVNLVEKIRKLHKTSPDAAYLRMKAEFLIGRYDLFSGSLKKGIENIHTSIALAKELDDRQCLLDNYLQMVSYAIQVHNLDMFNDYLTSCENLLIKRSFSEAETSTVKRLRGLYYTKVKDYDRAREIFEDLIKSTEEKHKDETAYQLGLAACYNYLGEICSEEEKHDEALNNFMHAIKCCETTEMTSSKGAVFYTNAGHLLYKIQKYNNAQMYIDKGIRCFEESRGIWGRSKAYSCAALLAIRRENWKQAIKYFRQAKEYAIKDENPDSMKMIVEVENLLKEHEKEV